MAVQESIKRAMAKARDIGYQTMYPWQVQLFLDDKLDVSTVRRHMVRMAEAGQIVRLGKRKGYQVPEWCWHQWTGYLL